MTRTVSKQVKFKEGDGFIHGFSTGMVKVKSKFRTARGNVLTSKINFLLDSEFTEYMPIMVWVVDHPEGVFVVDTGENANVSSQDYFKDEGFLLRYINKKSFIFDVKPEDEVGPQLKKLGYNEGDIKTVILTHLHLDHFDGLSNFENTDILVSQLEWDKPSSALPSLYPEWFSPKKVQLKSTKKDHFRSSSPLVESGEIELVHTPGHTVGHCSVLVKTAEMDYLLAGDITYNQSQLENNINAGGHQSFKLAEDTYKSVKSYAAKNELVYLPSHDNLVLDRLEKNEFLVVK
jgi:glyoxylase-like metal-dependent hydrolase (beta-lactamase superfamily II)